MHNRQYVYLLSGVSREESHRWSFVTVEQTNIILLLFGTEWPPIFDIFRSQDDESVGRVGGVGKSRAK